MTTFTDVDPGLARQVRAALLAGGLGERLGPLTRRECKPLVPYAGSCRLVDFSLANAARSGLGEVVLLTQHGERELIAHVLRHWDGDHGLTVHFGPQERHVRAAIAVHGSLPGGWQPQSRERELGTADALLANAEWLFAPGARDLLVQHADHVYALDYAEMIHEHRGSRADATIGVQQIERRFVSLFGMVEVDADGDVRRLVEKPADPTSDLVFTAFGLFRIGALEEVLGELAARGATGWRHDISHDVVPFMIERGYRVRAFAVDRYWADIGTVERYLLGHLALVQASPALPVSALPRTLPGADPAWLPEQQVIVNGSLPERASVSQSVLFPGCAIEPGARVERSVVLPGARVAQGVHVRDAIVLAGEALSTDRAGLDWVPMRSAGGASGDPRARPGRERVGRG